MPVRRPPNNGWDSASLVALCSTCLLIKITLIAHYTTPGDQTRNSKSGARARARVFFQDCVILPGGTRSVTLKTLNETRITQHATRNTQQTHATHARNKLAQRPIRSENTQNRVQPPKTSPIEQISDRCEPKISPLRRVTLQSLKSCYRWSILLRENVSNLAPASAQNRPKNLKICMKSTHFLIVFLNILASF